MNATRSFGPGALACAEAPPVTGPAPRTALPILQGHPQHLEAHLTRLRSGAEAVGQQVPWLASTVAPLLDWIVATGGGSDAALRLVLHPGVLLARLEALPTTPQPYRLVALPHPLSGRRSDPLLPHKGLAGPWWEAVLAEARDRHSEDALLLWSDGTVAETAIASVGVEDGAVLRMPPPRGRVASLAERLDLPAWAASRGLKVQVGEVSCDLARHGHLWCMNALRGIWPATLL